MTLILFVIQIIFVIFANEIQLTEWHQLERNINALSSSIPMPPPHLERNTKDGAIFISVCKNYV